MSYKIKLATEQINSIKKLLSQNQIPPTNDYTLHVWKYRYSTVTLYKTLTLLIQGRDEYEVYCVICDELGIEKIENTKEQIEIDGLCSIIGTDEVGTGDVFGGIVVCGAFVSLAQFSYLKRIGVKDSKQLSDYKICELAPLIMEKITYTIFKLDNLKYNFLVSHQKLNMNHIKSIMHNAVVNTMKNKVKTYDSIIIDGFTTKSNYLSYLKNEKKIAEDVLLIEKAEDKYLSVACASIIARYAFIKQLEELSTKVGFELPKGSGKVSDTAIYKIYTEQGNQVFKEISKMNFKNFDKYK